MPWQPWPYLTELTDTFQQNREVVILKARQLGISWLVVAYALWKALFFENVKILFISQGGKEAEDLIGGGEAGSSGKAKFIYQHLPDWMRPRLGRDTQGLIDFPATGGSLEALMSTDKAGRSTDATIVIRDELERHPFAEQNFASIGPTVDAGGQLIDLSTPDKFVAVEKSHFKMRYIKAKNHENNAKAVFLPWNLRPVRLEGMSLDDWFNKNIKTKYPAWQVEQEYPSTEDEALNTLMSVKFFDTDALEEMKSNLSDPIKTETNTFNGIIKIYKPPIVGEKYIVFTDPSDGSEDPFHTVVIKHSTGEEVANAHAKVKADMCAKIHDQLVRYYNNAYNSYEVNAIAGGKFDETIKGLDTPNISPRRDGDGKIQQGKRAWYTTPQVKKNMLWGLEECVRTRQIVVHDKLTLEEMNAFIRPEGEDPQATAGYHDDRVMAWGGVTQLMKHMPTGKWIVQSSKYHI